MKLIFAGTPSVAIPSLELLSHSKHEIACVLTRQDAPTGRKRVMTPSAVAEAAERLHIPVIKANSITGDVEHQLRDVQPDLGVVVAFGALLSSNVLSIPRLGWINLHFSALPQWRGAAPVQWELISGATSAHTSVFQLVEELDAGDVFSCESTAVYPFETAGALLNRLGKLGALNLAKVVDNIASGTASTVPQTGISTYARKLTLNDAKLDLHRTAEDVFNRFRGVTPEPGAWLPLLGSVLKVSAITHVAESPRLNPGAIAMVGKSVWLGTVTDALRLDKVQPAGKQEMNAADWFRGIQVAEGLSVDG